MTTTSNIAKQRNYSGSYSNPLGRNWTASNLDFVIICRRIDGFGGPEKNLAHGL